MKKLLIGLLALGSLTAFACEEGKVNVHNCYIEYHQKDDAINGGYTQIHIGTEEQNKIALVNSYIRFESDVGKAALKFINSGDCGKLVTLPDVIH